jgi:hypothetical protein
MDQGTLVESQIDDGQRLIEALVKDGIEVTGAAWVKESESGDSFLYLVTPLVGDDKPKRPIYGRINQVINRLRADGFWFDWLDVKVIGLDTAIGQALIAARDRFAQRLPTHFRGNQLGDLAIDEAYIYPAKKD